MTQTAYCSEHGIQPMKVIREHSLLSRHHPETVLCSGWLACDDRFSVVMTAQNCAAARQECAGKARDVANAITEYGAQVVIKPDHPMFAHVQRIVEKP